MGQTIFNSQVFKTQVLLLGMAAPKDAYKEAKEKNSYAEKNIH
jgi:hypothetical protein